MEYSRKITTFEQNVTSLNRENEELRRHLQIFRETNRKVTEYENKIALLSQEIERLNLSTNTKERELERINQMKTE